MKNAAAFLLILALALPNCLAASGKKTKKAASKKPESEYVYPAQDTGNTYVFDKNGNPIVPQKKKAAKKASPSKSKSKKSAAKASSAPREETYNMPHPSSKHSFGDSGGAQQQPQKAGTNSQIQAILQNMQKNGGGNAGQQGGGMGGGQQGGAPGGMGGGKSGDTFGKFSGGQLQKKGPPQGGGMPPGGMGGPPPQQ